MSITHRGEGGNITCQHSFHPWDYVTILITLDNIRAQCDWIMQQLLSVESSMRPRMSLMLESVDDLMELYKRVGP